jgi:ATP sulfurylase
VAPLKTNGQLVNDSNGKVEILIHQFKSVFTREHNTTLLKTTKHAKDTIPAIIIRPEGVEKLLKQLNPSKASGLQMMCSSSLHGTNVNDTGL